VRHVVVIGAGLGGLSAAIRLRRRGVRVSMLEKNGHLGGKVDEWAAGGYRFDTGPTLLTMPEVLREVFTAAGSRLEDHLRLERLDPLCRYRFADGSSLDASDDPSVMESRVSAFSPADAGSYRKFLSHAGRVYRAAAGPFLFTPLGSLRPAQLLRHAAALPAVFRLDAFRTLHAAVSSFFTDPRLVQLFDRFATYNGSSPYLAPATLAVIPYVEFHFGGWYVRGGMLRVARVLGELAAASGVEIRTDSAVESIETAGGRVTGVRLAGGEQIGADAVVCNADAVYARESLLGGQGGAGSSGAPLEASLAGFVLLLGVRKHFAELAHHNVFFSGSYEEEFRSLVARGEPARDPTVYVSVSSHTDAEHAPAGCSNLFVLVNAPPLGPGAAWEDGGRAYRDLVVTLLERKGLSGLGGAIEVERIITPATFAARFNAHRGSIYGVSSNSRLTAFRRQPNRSRAVRGLYFAGGSSHPGGGIPLVLLSGKMAADLAAEDILR
jgi:phytoene desaturase